MSIWPFIDFLIEIMVFGSVIYLVYLYAFKRFK